MKFTIELKTFTKMINTVSKKMPGQKKADADLRLSACAARVFVTANQTVAGIEALVFEDGQCVINCKRFVFVLGTYKGKKHLTIEVDEKWLKIGGFSQAIRGYSPQAQAPGKFQVFPVTDLSVLFPDTQPSGTGAGEQPEPAKPAEPQKPLMSESQADVIRKRMQDRIKKNNPPPGAATQPSETGAAELPAQSTPVPTPEQEALSNQLAAEELAERTPRFFHSEAEAAAWFNLPEGEFFSIPDDAEVFEHVVGYVRRICTLPKIKPQELAGLAHALYALERLPRVTPGVAVDFSVGVRWGTETEHSESWVTFHISEEEFNAGRMGRTRDPNVGGDHHTTTVFEISRYSHRTPQYEGDTGSWLRVLEWMGFVESLLEGDKTNLMLWVSDESKPDCMRGEAE